MYIWNLLLFYNLHFIENVNKIFKMLLIIKIKRETINLHYWFGKLEKKYFFLFKKSKYSKWILNLAPKKLKTNSLKYLLIKNYMTQDNKVESLN